MNKPKEIKYRIGKADIILYIAVAVLIIAGFAVRYFIYSSRASGSKSAAGSGTLQISVNSVEFGRYNMGTDQLIYIIKDSNGKYHEAADEEKTLIDKAGESGADLDFDYNVVRISDGEASMTEASCPDKLCEHEGRISKNGETIICLPNRVVLTVTDTDKEQDYDSFVK